MRQLNWCSAIATQCGVVPYVEGLPGVGKTAVFRTLAEKSHRRFVQCILRQMMPEDLGGIPVPADIEIGGTVHRAVVKTLSEEMVRAQHEPTLLLLDEFNHAGHDVMGAAQEWINNPPALCWMIACANPVEASTSGIELSAPVVNRMCVTTWERPIADRQAGWLNGFKDYPVSNLPLVPSDYLDNFGKRWGELLVNFEQRVPHLFGENAFPKDPSKMCQPWPSDRSWTNVGILMCGCDAVGANEETRSKCVRGCVGDGAACEFMAYMEQQDLPDPYELLENPHTLNIQNATFDVARAVLMSVLGAVQALATPEAWEQGANVIEVSAKQQKEITAGCFAKLWQIQPTGYLPRPRNGVFTELRKLLQTAASA